MPIGHELINPGLGIDFCKNLEKLKESRKCTHKPTPRRADEYLGNLYFDLKQKGANTPTPKRFDRACMYKDSNTGRYLTFYRIGLV